MYFFTYRKEIDSQVKNAVPYFVMQCKVSCKVWYLLLLYLDYLLAIVYLARIDDDDPGFEHDRWMKKRKPAEDAEELRADRWY